MGYKLCMAEKPSVAKDIARVIGATKRGEGYYEGNGYRVTWAVGHLVGLAEPEAYGFVKQADTWGDGKMQAYKELPLIPDEFKLVVLEPTKKQFKIVKDLINDPNCTEIINCGDMGAEGHILQWFIREKAGCKKPVRRFCATSMTDEAIKQAMAHLRREEEFANIVKGEFCKKMADWIMGMSISRGLSIKYGTNLTVGRVQSPTLWFVVERFLRLKQFTPTTYYGMDSTVHAIGADNESFKVSWEKDVDGVFPANVKDAEQRVLNKASVQTKCAEITRTGVGVVKKVETQRKGTERPQLYDITELQRDANRMYGYSASVTLATAQALYETFKVLSYPRTDSRYITTDLKPYMDERIKAIGTVQAKGEFKYRMPVTTLLKAGLNLDKRIVDDSKVTDHHALIPTEKIKGFNFSEFDDFKSKNGVTKDTLTNILNLVLTRMVVAFSTRYIYDATTVEVTLCGVTFRAVGSKPIDMGWKYYANLLSGKKEEKSDSDEEEQTFPKLTSGQKVLVNACTVKEKTTKPPELHTEATLLTAMENAGASLVGGEILKGRGIGTQATRAEIIKKLFDMEYCEKIKKGKKVYISPTKKGLQLIKALQPTVELYSPQITADWENQIAKIADGSMSEKEFMDGFIVFIREKVATIKSAEKTGDFKRELPSFGVCPWCGKGKVYRYESKDPKFARYYCSDGCGFSISTNDKTVTTYTGKKLTERQAQDLVKYQQVILECQSKVGGKPYKGRFTVVRKDATGSDGKPRVYCNLNCERLNSKK